VETDRDSDRIFMQRLRQDLDAEALIAQTFNLTEHTIEDRNSVGHIAEEAKQMHVEIMEERRGVEQAECYGFGSIIPCYLVHGSVTKVQAKTKYGRLVDEKTLEVVGVGDVVLKTTLGTSMTLKHYVEDRVRGSEMAGFNKPEWYFPLEFDMKDSGREEPYRYVLHVGDEREVEALRSFNWPSRVLMNGGVEEKREDTSTCSDRNLEQRLRQDHDAKAHTRSWCKCFDKILKQRL
ncbi:hypothetical protein Tco_1278283, partial [Tanacetum coccineum]